MAACDRDILSVPTSTSHRAIREGRKAQFPVVIILRSWLALLPMAAMTRAATSTIADTYSPGIIGTR